MIDVDRLDNEAVTNCNASRMTFDRVGTRNVPTLLGEQSYEQHQTV